jgi:hypothetical protein
MDFAPITIAPATKHVLEVAEGEELTIMLCQTLRSEFSGATMEMKTIGAVFDRAPSFKVSLTADTGMAVFNLATLKPAPGDYLVAFYGGAVAKYRHHLDAIATAEAGRQKAEQLVAALETEAKQLADQSKTVPAEKKEEADKAVEAVTARQKAAAAALTAAADQLKKATEVAQPRDIVDIVVSEPITIRVKPAEKK